MRVGSRAYVDAVLTVLARAYPDAHCELMYRTPFELLVATVLSAQCTDARVNSVTPQLFAKYPDAYSLAVASVEAIEEHVHSLGFGKRRAGQIVGIAKALVADHGGQVPAELSALTTLPGVGRKTANVVLGNAFGVPGITVDTHVGRLSRRLGFTRETDPVKVERDLQRIIVEFDWTIACHRLIFLGRRVCTARNPHCQECPVEGLCPRRGVVPSSSPPGQTGENK